MFLHANAKFNFSGQRWLLVFTLLIFVIAGFACESSRQESKANIKKPNQLTEAEIADGWTLLWDGSTFQGWRAIYKQEFPETGWIIENDALVCLGTALLDSMRGGAIITINQYTSFELKLEFKIQLGGNSGIKYFIDEELKASPGHGLGLEYAILDDENWPYDKPNYNRTCGSLYELVKADADKPSHPVGEWNVAKVIVDGNHIEHWLNGQKVAEIVKGSDEYRTLVAQSKYHKIEGWGEFPKGHILLQDEGPRAEFRNIKLREIK